MSELADKVYDDLAKRPINYPNKLRMLAEQARDSGKVFAGILDGISAEICKVLEELPESPWPELAET